MPEIERFQNFIINLKVNETWESVVFIGIYVYFHVQFLKTAKNNPPLSSPSYIREGDIGGRFALASLRLTKISTIGKISIGDEFKGF